MTTLGDREKDFENRFKHDQELTFKVNVRRNRLLAAWAAARLGLMADAADAYAAEVVSADFQKPGDEDVVEKVYGDLSAKGDPATIDQVRFELQRCAREAREQLMKE